MILTRTFYTRDTIRVARELLGKKLVCLYNGHMLCGIVNETEAYLGQGDTACHASKGRTPRTEIMFGEGGFAYVYFIYGMYFMLNVVTSRPNRAEAVLIRGVIPTEGLATMRQLRGTKIKDQKLADGPGKLCKAFGITKDLHNGTDLTLGSKIWFEDGPACPAVQIQATPRIGVNYAAPADRDALLRFLVKP